jgi:hypothetical protein
VTDDRPPQGELRVVARLAGRSLDETYRLFRMPGAPSPVDHVACVPVYDLAAALEWLHPEAPLDIKAAAADAAARPSQVPPDATCGGARPPV